MFRLYLLNFLKADFTVDFKADLRRVIKGYRRVGWLQPFCIKQSFIFQKLGRTFLAHCLFGTSRNTFDFDVGTERVPSKYPLEATPYWHKSWALLLFNGLGHYFAYFRRNQWLLTPHSKNPICIDWLKHYHFRTRIRMVTKEELKWKSEGLYIVIW